MRTRQDGAVFFDFAWWRIHDGLSLQSLPSPAWCACWDEDRERESSMKSR